MTLHPTFCHKFPSFCSILLLSRSARHSSTSVPQKPFHQPIIDALQHHLHNSNGIFLARQDIPVLCQELGLKPRELRAYVRELKRRSSGGILDAEKRQLVQKHLERIFDEMEGSSGVGHYDLVQIYNELQQIEGLDLSRLQLRNLVKVEVAKRARRGVNKEHRAIVRAHLSKLGGSIQDSSDNILQICDQLQDSISLPRQALYNLIAVEKDKIHRRKVTRDQKQMVRDHVESVYSQLQNARDDIGEICNGLNVDLPRKTLYELVRVELDRLDKKIVSNADRRAVREYLRNAGEDTRGNIVRLCDELQSKLDHLPRRVLYSLVHLELDKMDWENVTESHRETVREYLSQNITNTKYPPVKALADKLAPQITSLSRSVLRKVIQQEIDKMKRKMITEEHVQRIQEYLESIEHRPGTPSVGDICDALQPNMPELPRSVLYHLVRTATERTMRSKVTEQHRDIVHRHVDQYLQEHGTASLDTKLAVKEICERVVHSGEQDLPTKRALYFVARQEVLKRISGIK